MEKILVLSSEMQKQAELRVGEWKRLKKKLKNSDEEERHELIEEYHLSEEIFQLRKEITNLRKELVFAEDEFETDELNSIIGDLEQEMNELQEAKRLTGFEVRVAANCRPFSLQKRVFSNDESPGSSFLFTVKNFAFAQVFICPGVQSI